MKLSEETSLLLFYIGITLDLAGVALLLPFMDQYLALVGLSPTKDLGWIMSIYGAMQTIALPIAAHIAQRYKNGRRWLMIASTLGTPLSYSLKLVALHTSSVNLFLFSRVFTGITRHTMTAGSALMLDLAGDDMTRRATRVSHFQSAATIGFVVAPAVGGVVFQSYGAVYLAGLSVFVGFVAAALIFVSTRELCCSDGEEKKNKNKSNPRDSSCRSSSRSRSEHRKSDSSSSSTGVFAAITQVWTGPSDLRILAFAMLANSVAYVQSQSYYAPFLRGALGFESGLVGIIISSSAGCSAFSQAMAGRVLNLSFVTPRKVLLAATWACCAGASFVALSGVIASSSSYWSSSASAVFFVGMLCQSLTSGLVDAMAKSTLSAYFHGNNAIAMSLCYCADGGNRMLMPLLNSKLAVQFGAGSPMLSAAGAAVLAAAGHSLGPTATKRKAD